MQFIACAKCSHGTGDVPLRAQRSIPALAGEETEARVNDRDSFEILLILILLVYKLGSPYPEETLILRCHTFLHYSP